jgi:hypothetical protein
MFFLSCWGIWLARNVMLFEDNGIPSFQVAYQIRALDLAYKMTVIHKLERQLMDSFYSSLKSIQLRRR